MRICLCTISYRDKLLEMALDVARHIGSQAVELWGREPHVPETYDESRVRGVRKMAEERGLAIAVFGSYLTFGRTQERGEAIVLADTLHTAHALHAPMIRVWASDVGSAQATEQVWDRTVEEIREACDRAAKMNVVFAAEMHDATLADTGSSARRLVEQVGRGNFRLNFQVGNFEVEDQVERLTTVLPYVVHMHCQNCLHDPQHPGRYVRTQLHQGLVDYVPLVELLRGSGYQGHLAIEFAAQENEHREQSLRQDVQYLASLITN